MQHLVVVVSRAIRLVDQVPGRVVELDRQCTLLFGSHESSCCSDSARFWISETTAGSASVVVSPSGRCSATSRNRRRMIFPLRVFGSSGVKTMFAGLAIGPIFFAT